MSTEPRVPDSPPQDRQPVTLPRLAEMKRLGEPIVMVTAYDYPSARAAEAAGGAPLPLGDNGGGTRGGDPLPRGGRGGVPVPRLPAARRRGGRRVSRPREGAPPRAEDALPHRRP